MSFSIRIGFLFAILSVIIGAGIYQGARIPVAQPIVFHIKPATFYTHRPKAFPFIASNFLDRFQFKADQFVLGAPLHITAPILTVSSPAKNKAEKNTIALKYNAPSFRTVKPNPKLLAPSLLLSANKTLTSARGYVLLKNKPRTIEYTVGPSHGLSGHKAITRTLPSLTVVDYFTSLFQSNDAAFWRQKNFHHVKVATPTLSKNNHQALRFSNTALKIQDNFFQTPVVLPLHKLTLPTAISTQLPKIVMTGASDSTQPPAEISVESAALMGDIGHTQLMFRLSKEPFYSVSTDNALQVITLTVENINPDISSIPPLDTRGTAIQNVTFNVTPSNQLTVTLTLLPQVDLQGLRFVDNNLVMDVGMDAQIPYINSKNNPTQNVQTQNTPPSATTPSGADQPLVKTFVPLTPTELATENYDEAVDLLNQGNTQGAIGLLQMLVTEHPTFLNGRVLLANLLLEQNEAQQALDLLLNAKEQPNVQDNSTFYSLLAEAYRQTGDMKSAIKIYRLLLSMDPSNGGWWIGLGMCFEALNQNSAAMEAYQKAKVTENLSPVLQEFVAGKLGISQ